MSMFNARASRSKRPLPLWVDAFQRDTQHLQADEIGAYILILMAMWSRESCDFPDDAHRLARVSRVSTRLWNSRIGPAIRDFLMVESDVVQSRRLRKEAEYVERQVARQSNRKVGEKSGNSLKSCVKAGSADFPTDQPRNCPSQQPNNPSTIPIADAIGGDAPSCVPSEEVKRTFWADAKAYLRRSGVSDRNAGTFIGKCLREHGLERARTIFHAAQAAGAAEPVPWISAALNKPAHQPAINHNVNRMLNERLGISDKEACDEIV